MKRHTLIILLGIVTGAACFYQPWLTESIPVAANSELTDDTDSLPAKYFRPTVAFILGEDKEKDNPYYQEALRYYTSHPKGKTDFVVNTCRSLEEVKTYLAEHAVLNAQPWGDIHLVSHGNQWSGLSVKVAPDAKRATASRILEHTQQPGFEFLPNSVVDDLSRIFIHSCGVGNDASLADAVRVYLGCPQFPPVVYAPKLFEFYTSGVSGEQSQQYLAENWLLNYPLGERPSDIVLMNELREKYSDVPIDWHGALQREQPRWLGDSYHYTFEVPVKWVVPVDSAVNLATAEMQNEWLRQQSDITRELERLQLPLEKFKWTLAAGYAERKDGGKQPAISVKGYCTMLCVVKAVVNNTPARSDIADSRYYYKSSTPLLVSNQ